MLNSDSEAEEKSVVAKPPKVKGRAASVKPPSTQPSTATRTTRGKATSQKQPLFILDSDDDGEEDADKDDDFRMGSDFEDEVPHDEEDEDEFGATLKSTGRSSRTATQASPKGKSGRGAATKKKAPAVVVDDDSDDGGFKAFGARTRTRRR